jgi:hypothetical protein
MNTLALVSIPFLVAFAATSRPVVQVRDIPNAPTVSIVGWDNLSPEYGLRTRLRRDGSHLGEDRVGEHRLYLSLVFVEANGGFTHAVAHHGKLLRTIASGRATAGQRGTPRGLDTAFMRDTRGRDTDGVRDTEGVRDADACRFGNVCSPATTVGIGISDELLREHRDSLVVTLRPRNGRHWTIRLDSALINAYLATTDSVSASLKKP